MSFIPAKCTQCGANIEVDDTKEAGICNNCGTAFVTEKAIKNYTTYITNNYNIQSADFSSIQDTEKTLKFNLNEALNKCEALIKIGEYSKAKKIAEEIIDNSPEDYRGHLLMLKIRTRDFTSIENENEYELPYELTNGIIFYNKFCVFAPDEIKSNIDKKILPYKIKLLEINAEIEKEEMESRALKRKWKIPSLLITLLGLGISLFSLINAKVTNTDPGGLTLFGFVAMLIGSGLMAYAGWAGGEKNK